MSPEEQNQEDGRRAIREIDARIRESVASQQRACLHRQGCINPHDYVGDLTSIIWHQLDRDGGVIGICFACQRLFVPTDPDFLEWYRKPCGNRLSTGGIPVRVVPGSTEPWDYAGPTLPPDPLDDLTDDQIADVFEAVREERKRVRRTPIVKSEAVPEVRQAPNLVRRALRFLYRMLRTSKTK